jgi:hypothetical protein
MKLEETEGLSHLVSCWVQHGLTDGCLVLPDRQADHGSGADGEYVVSPCCRLRHGG